MNEMILLGAGASVEAGILPSKKITPELYKGLMTEDKTVLLFLARGMMNHRVRMWAASRFNIPTMRDSQDIYEAWDMKDEPFYPDVDIEELYSAVELLAEGDKIQHSAFLQWDEMTKAITGWPHAFENLAKLMRREVARMMVITDPKRVDYLSPILDLSRQQPGVTVANLNWDNAIELLASEGNVVVDSGLNGWCETGSFQKQDLGITLLKLHGSCSWAYSNERGVMVHEVVQEIDPQALESRETRPAVIFGLRNKLTAAGPFMDMLRAFKDNLSSADRLTIIGYSFRDEHVNVHIAGWLNQHPESRIVVIDPDFDTSKQDFVVALRKGLPAGRIKRFPQRLEAGDQKPTRDGLKEWLDHINAT
ncbi:MAG TPA: hypothetical protein VM223_13060 [Planctomycetota bacterium]|nr:hypothetical protein [Planctomycetota bacterium]